MKTIFKYMWYFPTMLIGLCILIPAMVVGLFVGLIFTGFFLGFNPVEDMFNNVSKKLGKK